MSIFNNNRKGNQYSDILVNGPTPLTTDRVDEYCSFVEWIMDITLPSQVRDMIQEVMIRAWADNNQMAVTLLLNDINTYEQVKQQTKSMQDYSRESQQQTFMNNIQTFYRQNPGFPLFSTLLQLYNRANAPIAQGYGTSLTSEEANSLLDFYNFIEAKISGSSEKSITPQMREAQIQSLCNVYNQLPQETREIIDYMPIIWTRIHALWPNISSEEQNTYVQLWTRHFQNNNAANTSVSSGSSMTNADRLNYETDKLHQEVSNQNNYNTSRAYTPTPKSYQNSDSAAQIQSTIGTRGGNLKRLTQQMIEAQNNNDTAEATRLQYEIQMENQRQATNMTLLNQMSAMNFKTSMKIIDNIKY